MYQLKTLFNDLDALHLKYGDSTLSPVYGAGQIKSPEIFFVFMNPTKRNISAQPNWKGIRAPWLGTKLVWNIFHSIGKLSTSLFTKTQNLRPNEWTAGFAEQLYLNLAENSVYVTNLAKCTQRDARPLKDQIFRDYLETTFSEITITQPRKIITFGNQVSSVLLQKKIKVSEYTENMSEDLKLENTFNVFPVFYPVGQGQRNMGKSVNRIVHIISQDAF